MLQTGPIFFKRDSLPMPISSDPSMQVNLGMYYQTIVITWTIFFLHSIFYDFWIESRWIHLNSWIQLILKSYSLINFS